MVHTLENMLAIYGDRQVVVVRELTKLYEEYQRGLISEVLAYLAEHPIKGECLIIVSGFDGQLPKEDFGNPDPLEAVKELIDGGQKPNQAIKKIAKERGLNRQELYNAYHNLL